MMSDQEVIIMCKPPEPVVTSRKAASYAGKLYVISFSCKLKDAPKGGPVLPSICRAGEYRAPIQ